MPTIDALDNLPGAIDGTERIPVSLSGTTYDVALSALIDYLNPALSTYAIVVAGPNAGTGWSTRATYTADGTDDGVTINTALAAAATAKRPVILRGDFSLRLSVNKNFSGLGSDYVSVVVPGGLHIDAHTATFTYDASETWLGTLADGRRQSLFINETPGDVATPDAFTQWHGGTINGSSAAITALGTGSGQAGDPAGGREMMGVRWQRTYGFAMFDVDVKNIRGTSGGGGAHETFFFDDVGGVSSRWVRCRAYSDDGGLTATGFSANSSEAPRWEDCLAYGIDFHGFTAWFSWHGKRIGCHSYGNGSAGARVEEGGDWDDIGCSWGGRDRWSDTNVRGDFPVGGNGGYGLALKRTIAYRMTGGQVWGNTDYALSLNHALGYSFSGVAIYRSGTGIAVKVQDNGVDGETTRSWGRIDPSCTFFRDAGTDATEVQLADWAQTAYGTNNHNARSSGFLRADGATDGPAVPATATAIENYFPLTVTAYINCLSSTSVTVTRQGRSEVVFDSVTGPVSVEWQPGDSLTLTYAGTAPEWKLRTDINAEQLVELSSI